ncbi:MAG: ribulose-phosphate 3-epimerase [Firmicutes bacterium]|nr:ribulose-phosphate 3-epimerase [Bacillota bacterium]
MMQSSEMQANGRRWRWLQNPCLVSPSLMCADLLRLGEDIKALEVAGADALHVDVMDGHYVDNLALGYDLLKQVRDATHLPIDVHLMVEHPESCIERVLAAGADLCIIHSETTRTPLRLLRTIHATGAAAGIAINPATTVESIELLLPLVQMVLVMTVEPGFAGQRLVGFTLEKIEQLAALRASKSMQFTIGVDGAVSQEVVSNAASCGATFFVGGTSGVFLGDGTDFTTAIKGLKQAAKQR